MFLDIIVGIILIATMVSGFRKGFVFTILHALGWFGAMVIAFFAAGPVRKLLLAHTDMNTSIYTMFYDKLSLSADSLNASANSLPSLLGAGVNTASAEAAKVLAEKLTFFTMIIICFVAVLLLMKVVFFFLTIAFSKRDNKGFINIADGLLGIIAGAVRGVIFVFLFLAVLIPLVNLISPASTQLVVDSLNASYFAKTLYDSNFIIVLINDFLA